MKKYILGVAIFLFTVSARAQILTPVKWAYAAKKINDKEAVVLVKATIEKGWHIYSQHVAEGGPAKTEISFEKSDGYALVGTSIEPKPVKKFEKAFDMNVAYFENTVVFQQKVKLIKDNPEIKGKVAFMVCSNKECLPPDNVEFTVTVK